MREEVGPKPTRVKRKICFLSQEQNITLVDILFTCSENMSITSTYRNTTVTLLMFSYTRNS
jgi:hypothetical protein